LLRVGRFDEGWREYEWRRKIEDFPKIAKTLSKPVWDGTELQGKRVLVHEEQGFGDSIQFIRYLPLIAERGGRVTLSVRSKLARLFDAVEGFECVVAEGQPLGDYDCHTSLASLPLAFGTTAETIPATVPYLQAEDGLVEVWKERVGTEGLRVGVNWQGNDFGRSVPLACFQPLAVVSGVRLISLQVMHGLDQLDNLPQGMRVETLGNDFDAGPDAFIDTAAVMMNLDLIVTSDTAVAHLAGALGRPVWVVLKTSAEWRWELDRDESPWYPTMRLFRQSSPGVWLEVFARVGDKLEALIDGRAVS